MAAPTPAFGFDENAAIETNLSAFNSHLARTDSLLGSVLLGTFPKLRDESYVAGDIWTALYAALLNSEDASPSVVTEPPVAASTTLLPASVAGPVAGGWFLEGVSIEGFRGINNEGKPLELKFKPDKVNSVSAVNGVGKTSIYDAIRFAISGRLGTVRNSVREAGSSLVEEPFAEDDGELGFGLEPFARRTFPVFGRVVQHQV